MSSIKIGARDRQPADTREELFLPVVNGMLEAGENLMTGFRNIALGQGLCSKGMALTVWKLHLQRSPMKVGDLAHVIDCDAGNTSGLLDKLQEAGLVERVHSGDDRRVRLIQLTMKGHKLGAQMESAYRNSWMYKELSALSQRDRECFKKILDQLNAAASREQ